MRKKAIASWAWLLMIVPALCLSQLAYADLTSTGMVALNDLGPNPYKGYPGGLYPESQNARPEQLATESINRAQQKIRPLDSAGNPDPTSGKIVLISIGMSNTTQEFASKGSGAFRPRAIADKSRNPRLFIVDCAQGGQTGLAWSNPNAPAWTVADQRITSAGCSLAQVQAAWVKLAERGSDLPDKSFPAHAQWLQGHIEAVLRNLKNRYPNIQMVFLSSRTRSYTNNINSLNPEPIAYESGFSVKWLIERQMNGAADLNFDPAQGAVVAPLALWGPYIWTDGLAGRSDGFIWDITDLESDLTHPSALGARKVADQLICLFKTDPATVPWFLRSSVTGQAPTCSIDSATTQGPAPLSIQFHANAQDSDGTIIEYAWTFGDGNFAYNEQNPVKIFPVPGEYLVRLTVTDNSGNPVNASRRIVITPPKPTEAQKWDAY